MRYVGDSLHQRILVPVMHAARRYWKAEAFMTISSIA